MISIFKKPPKNKPELRSELCYSHDVIFGVNYGYRALRFINYLYPKDALGKELVRVGNQWDGGYSMLDDFSSIHTAYGFGVGGDWSWDLGLASRGIDVFMFDPTVTDPTTKINNPRIRFYEFGIAVNDIPDKKMYSLKSLMSLDDNWNKTNMILKIDIEGGEFEVLFDMKPSTLEKFSQILVEFHWMDDVLASDEKYRIGLSVLEKLNKTHQLMWIHPCNYSPNDIYGGVPFPRVFEVLYVKRTENIEFTNRRRRKRIDERSDTRNAELLLWWLEGENMDELLDYYETGQFISK